MMIIVMPHPLTMQSRSYIGNFPICSCLYMFIPRIKSGMFFLRRLFVGCLIVMLVQEIYFKIVLRFVLRCEFDFENQLCLSRGGQHVQTIARESSVAIFGFPCHFMLGCNACFGSDQRAEWADAPICFTYCFTFWRSVVQLYHMHL